MKTTLKKLISEIDFTNKSMADDVNWEDLSSEFNIYDLYWSGDERLKCYFIKTWYCSDSYVGIRAYFLDGKFVAISTQKGRKDDEHFEFVSLEIAKEVRDYLLTLTEKEDTFKVSVLTDDELSQEIPNTYKIEYNSQIRHSTALLNRERVTIVKKHYRPITANTDDYFHSVIVEKQNLEKVKIDCRELDFEYNTIN